MIAEASLRYRWGMHTDRKEQIEHLAEMSRRRNIELRIQRFDDGPEVSKPESVRGYVQSFERACDAALEPGTPASCEPCNGRSDCVSM